MHVPAREVFLDGRPVDLTAKEFDLARLFLSNQQRVMSKEAIINGVWGYDFPGDDNITEVYVGRLRKKLGESFALRTIRGVGYSLRPAD